MVFPSVSSQSPGILSPSHRFVRQRLRHGQRVGRAGRPSLRPLPPGRPLRSSWHGAHTAAGDSATIYLAD
eukprot:scaffold523581_cov51-Prasinocladus_malaysianus.AAC.1